MFPVAVQFDTTDIPGVTGRLVPPMAPFTSLTPTVIAMGRPVLTMGSPVPTHGNPFNPKAPGFNPPCAGATIVGKVIPNILVGGKPLAVLGSVATCTHMVLGPGAPTVVAGFGGA
jgi:uncharacterized Zn-binding protein involved in type VI secretion